MSRRLGQTWREWFFEVFAVNSRMPFHPLPTTEAERLERVERDTPKDITRLNLEAGETAMVSTDEQRAYVKRWATTRTRLEEIRWRELRALDDAAARAATAALIEAALLVPLPASRLERSGLIDQQDLLHRQRSR